MARILGSSQDVVQVVWTFNFANSNQDHLESPVKDSFKFLVARLDFSLEVSESIAPGVNSI